MMEKRSQPGPIFEEWNRLESLPKVNGRTSPAARASWQRLWNRHIAGDALADTSIEDAHLICSLGRYIAAEDEEYALAIQRNQRWLEHPQIEQADPYLTAQASRDMAADWLALDEEKRAVSLLRNAWDKATVRIRPALLSWFQGELRYYLKEGRKAARAAEEDTAALVREALASIYGNARAADWIIPGQATNRQLAEALEESCTLGRPPLPDKDEVSMTVAAAKAARAVNALPEPEKSVLHQTWERLTSQMEKGYTYPPHVREEWVRLWRDHIEGDNLNATNADDAYLLCSLGMGIAAQDDDLPLAIARLERWLEHPRLHEATLLLAAQARCRIASCRLAMQDEAGAARDFRAAQESATDEERRHVIALIRSDLRTHYYYHESVPEEPALETMAELMREVVGSFRGRKRFAAGIVPGQATHRQLAEALESTRGLSVRK